MAATLEVAEPAETYLAGATAAREAREECHSEKGVHPYRVLLSDLLRRMRNTRSRAQAALNGAKPDDAEDWCAPQPLRRSGPSNPPSRCKHAAHAAGSRTSRRSTTCCACAIARFGRRARV